MDEMESLSHTKWECKYHVVFIPKCRRKTLYGELRRHLGEVFRKLAEQKESRIEEGHLMPDHVRMMVAIPAKYAVSQVIGLSRGERDSLGAGVRREEAKLCRAAFLGAGVLGVDGRPERGSNTSIHPEPGARGPAIGPDQPVALTGRRYGGPKQSGPRQRPRLAALSGSQPIIKPPALPGDIYTHCITSLGNKPKKSCWCMIRYLVTIDAPKTYGRVVAVNSGSKAVSQTFSLNGFSTGSVTPWVTLASLSLVVQTPISVSGANFTYKLPASSVTTFLRYGLESTMVAHVLLLY